MNPLEVSARLKAIAANIQDNPDKDATIEELKSILAAVDISVVQPSGALIYQLNKWLTAKYAIDIAYRSFADRVRGPWRDALVKHWYEHAEEERQASYDLAMKIAALGFDPMVTHVDVPQCPPNLQAMCSVLAGMELQTIENAYITMEMMPGDATIRVMAENIMLKDTQHLDDIMRMCDWG